MTLIWDTGNSVGLSKVRATVYYSLPDDGLRSVLLEVAGKVEPDFRVEPEELTYSPDGPSRQEVAIFPGRLKAGQIKTARCSHKAFTAKVNRESSTVEVVFDRAEWPREQQVIKPLLIVETDQGAEANLHVRIIVVD